jgi:sugar phosphate isomerase/epimerase
VECDLIRHDLLRAAEALGARHIKVTPDGDDGPWDRERWAAKFAELAAQAQDAGTRLGIEFFRWSNIKSLREGLRLVEAAGHDGAGVVIDVWHIQRAHTPVAELAAVPLHRIIGVEILSVAHRALPVGEALHRVAVSARRQLALPSRPE